MSKDRSLKPKRQLRTKRCTGQLRASERKRRNKQRKGEVDPDMAYQRYLEAKASVKNIRDTEFRYPYRSRDW